MPRRSSQKPPSLEEPPFAKKERRKGGGRSSSLPPSYSWKPQVFKALGKQERAARPDHGAAGAGFGVTYPELAWERDTRGGTKVTVCGVTQRRGGNMLGHRQQAWFAFCAAKTRGRGEEEERNKGKKTHRNSVSGLMEPQVGGEDPPKLVRILSFSSTFLDNKKIPVSTPQEQSVSGVYVCVCRGGETWVRAEEGNTIRDTLPSTLRGQFIFQIRARSTIPGQVRREREPAVPFAVYFRGLCGF